MKGGNEASAASGITHSPLGEPKRSKCTYQTDAAESLPRMAPALGRLCWNKKNSHSQNNPSDLLDRGCLSRIISLTTKNT